jgi:hypothetical protein
MLNGEKHRVEMVNDCRARCVPLAKRERVITPLVGEPVTIQSTGSAINISPNSEIEIL